MAITEEKINQWEYGKMSQLKRYEVVFIVFFIFLINVPLFSSEPAIKKWGYIDKTGNVVIELNPGIKGGYCYSEGFARVRIDNRWGYIDKVGKIVIKPRFDMAANFSEGLAVVQVSNRKGYIDKTGKIVGELKFYTAYDFSDGLARKTWGRSLEMHCQ